MPYLWISNGGCLTCDQLATQTHPDRPQRPHKHCRCTIHEPTGSGRGYCTLPHNSVLSITETGVDYSPDSGIPDRITFEYDIEILCRDESTMTVSATIDLQGSELGNLQSMDEEEALNLVSDKIKDKSLELADQLCPACPRQLS